MVRVSGLAAGICGLFAGLCLSLLPVEATAQTRAKLQGNVQGVKLTVDKRDVVIVAVSLQNVGGKLGVCALSWPEPARTSVPEFKNALLRDLVVVFRGRPLQVSLASAPFYLSEAEARAGTGRCYTVNRPWADSMAREAFEVRTSEGRIRN